MSSILDALKKSEAERQRGAPPTLSTPILHRGQPAKSGRPAWLLPAVAVGALVLAWAGGLFSSGSSDGDDDSSAEQVSAPAEPAPAAEPPVAATPDTGASTPAATAAPAADGDTAVAANEAPPPARSSLGFGPARPARPASPPPDAVEPPPASTAPVAANTPAPEPIAAPVAPPPAPPEAPATAAPAQPAPAPAAPVPAAPMTAGDQVPTLNELPYAVRREVPPLAVTLHMYSTDPARRFAIINGVRVTDGQPLEGGIDVKAIHPNGVLVRYKDTDFLLPARG